VRKIGLILLGVLITSTAFAGGSIFGGHKHKTVNTNGVYAIGVHICSSLECPPIRIVEGKCDGENMSKHWGVCVCEAGYMPKDGSCEACPEGQYSDGINACQDCPQGQYIAHDGDTQCSDCPSEHYCKDGQAFECPDHAICSDTGFECEEEYVLKDNTCVLPSGRLLEYDGDEDACLWYTYKDEKCYDEESITESDCESIYHARWCEWRNGSHFCSLSNNCCLINGSVMISLVSGAVECSSKVCNGSTDYRWVDQIKPDGTKCGVMPNPGGFCIDGQCVTEINETDCATYDGTWCEWYDGSNFCSPTGNCCIKDWAMMTVAAEEECSSKICDDSTGYRWVYQPKQDGITCESGVCQSGECTSCPTNANCTSTPWTCNDGYYKNTATTCASCQSVDEHATTCNDSGTPTDCVSGYEPKDGACVKIPTCDINPATDCISGALVDGQCACAPAEDGATCTSWTNNECGQGKYCVFSPTGCGDDAHGTGTCQPVGYIGDYKTETVNDHEYTMSDCSNCPDWWSAQSWCKAFDKTMVSLEDIHCNSSGCTDTLWQDLGNALYKYSTWTTDMYDYCDAFIVYLGGGYVYYYNSRDDDDYEVLCQ